MKLADPFPPYGLWPSPFTPERLAASRRLHAVAWDREGTTAVWLEGRSDQGVLVARRLDQCSGRDLTAEQSVRARVGYGGGDFAVGEGAVVFVAAGRLYRQLLQQGSAVPITPAFGEPASPAFSPDGRWVAYVHSYEGEDCLAVVDAEGKGWPRRLVRGEDFYMQPSWHPAGDRLAYVCWNHPHMPWDGTWLKVATVGWDVGGWPTVREITTVAGGDEAILQPLFSPDGRYLLYASDRDGWWNLYLTDLHSGDTRQLTHEADAEIGYAAWLHGEQGHAFAEGGRRVVYIRRWRGMAQLMEVDWEQGTARALPGSEEYTAFASLATAPGANGRRIAVVASSSAVAPRVVVWTDQEGPRVLARSDAENLPAEVHAPAEPVSWQGEDGQTVFGLLYRPVGQGRGVPPGVLLIHGGPTGQAEAEYNPQVQFFTSRGYVVLQVNYRGSTGYGRAYRDALRHQWGVLDVADAISAAEYLVASGPVDPRKLVIMGGSAGGYTVLRTLSLHPRRFKAGVCLYGVSNLFTLAAETHKFEQRYLDQIVGPLPEAADVYRERSPIFSADRIVDPIILFQGEEDRVVPKSQADTLVASLRARGVPHEYHVYPGEGHGWRRMETVRHFYAAVDAFLRAHVVFA